MLRGAVYFWLVGCVLAAHALCAAEPAPDAVLSLRRTARVLVGGELAVDYTHRTVNTTVGGTHTANLRAADLSVRRADLRLEARMHPGITAFFKINLQPERDAGMDRAIVDEAFLVMESLCGTGFGLFAGLGTAPYGQDITLGILQSYNHGADRSRTNAGPIYITDPADAAHPAARPGTLERTVMAGAQYVWDDRWCIQLAAISPERERVEQRLGHWAQGAARQGNDIGFAGRVWMRPLPFEDLTLEASVLAPHSSDLGRTSRRADIAPGAEGRSHAYALSLGFDWKHGAWRVFGEYQHGWNWNHTKGYATDTWQLGAARELADGAWRIGAMGEALRIRDPDGFGVQDQWYKLAFNIRHAFAGGTYILGEWGYEWHRRRALAGGALARKDQGYFVGLRVGYRF